MAEKHDEPGKHSGSISGLRWEAEECPDATRDDVFRSTGAGGVVGYLSAVLLGASPGLRIAYAVAGAAIGHVASKYHVNLDWDPDHLRGDSMDPPAPPRDDPDPDVQPL